MNYSISDIYPAIQGEGCQTGVPMVILRTQGCGVGCSFCDTKQTWALDKKHEVPTIEAALGDGPEFVRKSASEIAYYISVNFPRIEWVLLTGGEPAEQDLEGLLSALHDVGKKVALETSGTALGHVNQPFDWVCVSPKIGMPGGKKILAPAIKMADEIKHVVGKPADLEKLEALLAEFELKENVQICLQPMSASVRATDLCIQTVQERNWRLSIQVHKVINQR